MVLAFDDFELDVPKRELRRHGTLASLEHKAFDLIAVLIEHRACVVSKEELIETVW